MKKTATSTGIIRRMKTATIMMLTLKAKERDHFLQNIS